GKSIEEFIYNTEYVEEFYGKYEYYTLLIPFLENLYSYETSDLSKDLYINISNELKNRLLIFNQMEQNEKSDYVENIANNLFQYTKILKTLKDLESDQNFVKSEIETFLSLKEKLTN
ncbi:MAG: hypothetical protein P8O81_00640, partial [Flavobacteriaceae bacterium]|nr:hypothetical protein [Flavobacteriaceae bacterium]